MTSTATPPADDQAPSATKKPRLQDSAQFQLWVSIVVGIGVTMALFFVFMGWFLGSADVPELVTRVVTVGSVVVAVGSMLQLGAHTGHRFGDAIGKGLVASGAALTALVSVLGSLPFGLF